MLVKDISCKTALSRSLLPGLDYTLNPYRGCEHACVYCYAPYVLKEKRKWGSFVDVKANMPLVLSRELKRAKKGVVGISTVTDAYQPIEKKREITRRCLEQLLKYDFSISVQTKSSLVLRDLDLIKRFSQKEIGFTITTMNDEMRKKYEPFASPVTERLDALREISKNGIKTWVFIGPIITDKDEDFEALVEEIAKVGVEKVLLDKFRLKIGMSDIFRGVDYERIKEKVASLCEEHLLKFDSCF